MNIGVPDLAQVGPEWFSSHRLDCLMWGQRCPHTPSLGERFPQTSPTRLFRGDIIRGFSIKIGYKNY
jgi:hypothetical protein